MEKQTDCEVCTGKEVVEDGVCRNCGAGKEVGSSLSREESEKNMVGSSSTVAGGSGVTEPAKTE